MNQREQLRREIEVFREGVDFGLEQGREEGVQTERTRIRRIEWSKLFVLVVAGSVIGCGLILALAVGLSHV